MLRRITFKMNLLIILLLLASTLQTSRVLAGTEGWNGNGPEGGHVLVLTINPSVPSEIYTGTRGGLFRSINGGENWNLIDFGSTSAKINSVVIDKETSTTIYVGTSPDGMFKSINGGKDWNAINHGLSNTYITSLAACRRKGMDEFWATGRHDRIEDPETLNQTIL